MSGCAAWSGSGSTAALAGRFDASDILRDAYLALRQRLAEFARDPGLSFFLRADAPWLL